MDNKAIIEALKFQPLTEEEKSKRHILGRLYGPIATCKESTRNGRKYNRELWENALSDPLMGEKIKNKSLFLELGHPLDGREETIMANACACIPELPKIVDDQLIAYVDILDTPNGRILKTLCDYGFVPGISSRGTGDVIGDEVDPETFQLETWDIVQLPAVESARLSMTESLDPNQVKLRKALTESLNSASEEDKKVMEESLQNLGIDATSIEKAEDATLTLESNGESHLDIKPGSTELVSETINEGLETAIKSLQEAIVDKAKLEVEIKSLQEQLAVSNTKVNSLKEELGRYKSATMRLSSIASEKKALSKEIVDLTEKLNQANNTILEKDKALTESSQMKATTESASRSLKESVSKKDIQIKELNESLASQKEDYETKLASLNEAITKEKANSEAKCKELTESINKLTNERNGWKRTAIDTVNSYIDTKALMLGVEADEIKNKLPETYNIKDIDTICENLSAYTRNLSRLPFHFDARNAKIKVNESKTDALRNQVVNDDDDITDGLIRMSGLNN